jgi:ASC-1-like (ASCH) protein
MLKKEDFLQFKSGEKDVELRNVQPQCKNSRDGDEAALANIIQDVYKQEVKSNSGDLYG